MESSALTLNLGSPFLKLKALSSITSSYFHLPISNTSLNQNVRVHSSSPDSSALLIASCNTLKTSATTAIVFAVTAFSVFGKFHHLTARAETTQTLTEEICNEEENNEHEKLHEEDSSSSFLSVMGNHQSDLDAVDSLKLLLEENILSVRNGESLKILNKLVEAQPENNEWKFLTARLLIEMGQIKEARKVFEEILERTPFSFEALFEYALLMDRCGDGEGVVTRLRESLTIAEDENKVKEARDVRLIMAQIQFLQKNVVEALKSCDELSKEDPNDFRPYFCKGMIYSLLNKNEEAIEQFAKYRQLLPKKCEVEEFLRKPLSRMKIYGTDDAEEKLN